MLHYNYSSYNLHIFQTETVKNAQNTLVQILTDLESAKTEEDVQQLRSDAQAAKDKADSAIMVLQVLVINNLLLQSKFFEESYSVLLLQPCIYIWSYRHRNNINFCLCNNLFFSKGLFIPSRAY